MRDKKMGPRRRGTPASAGPRADNRHETERAVMPLLEIVVLGPGPGAAGGVGVMMDYTARTSSNRTTLRFVETVGRSGRIPARLSAFFGACAVVLGPSRQQTFHVNLASGGSAVRKVLLTSLLRIRRKPYVIHLHGGGFDCFFESLRGPARRVVVGMFRAADTVAVLGSFWEGVVVDVVGVARASVVRLPNAVPGPVSVPERETPLRFLFLGQVGVRKGASELLRAWAQLARAKEAELVLAGDIKDEDGTVTAAVESARNVTLVGWLDADAVVQQLRQASVLVLPSREENLPLSLLEAAAWGLVPVVTPVGAVPDVVTDGVNGLLVPVADHEALCDALKRLVDDEPLRRRLGAEIRRTWEDGYDLASYRDRFDEIHLQVAARRFS